METLLPAVFRVSSDVSSVNETEFGGRRRGSFPRVP